MYVDIDVVYLYVLRSFCLLFKLCIVSLNMPCSHCTTLAFRFGKYVTRGTSMLATTYIGRGSVSLLRLVFTASSLAIREGTLIATVNACT